MNKFRMPHLNKIIVMDQIFLGKKKMYKYTYIHIISSQPIRGSCAGSKMTHSIWPFFRHKIVIDLRKKKYPCCRASLKHYGL